MIKKIIAVVLILLAGGTWFYLDYLNKQELLAAEQAHQAVEQARAQAKARAEARGKFEAQILADLNNCRTSAEKARDDFLTLNRKPVRRKPGQFTLSQAALDEAEKTLEAATAACRAAYDTRLQQGS